MEMFLPVLMALQSTVLGQARLIILHSITPSSALAYMSHPSLARGNLCATSESPASAWLIQSAKAISFSSRILIWPNMMVWVKQSA